MKTSSRAWSVTGALSLMLMLAAAFPLVSPAASPPTAPGKARMCLEVYNGAKKGVQLDLRRGEYVDQWSCYPGHANQEWTPTWVEGGGEFGTGIYQLKNALTGMCLDVYNGSHTPPKNTVAPDMRNGDTVDQWTCFPGHYNQEWEPRVVAPNGRYGQPAVEWVSRQSNKCLDVFNGDGHSTQDMKPGAHVDQWTCFTGHTNQEWEDLFAPINNGIDFELVNENG